MTSVPPADSQQPERVQLERIYSPFACVVLTVVNGLRVSAFLVFAGYWCIYPGWWSDPWQVAIAILATIAFIGSQLRWSSLTLMARPVPISNVPDQRVAVVTTCVPSVEPVDVIEQTLRSLVALDYPHDTWLLDEDDEPRLRAACQRLGVRHFSRKHKPKYQQPRGTFAAKTKHGNYNAWLDETGYANYDILIAFDPDHVPVPEFTSSLLGYFNDSEVAYVQTPQAYHNQSASMVARGAAEESYGYYSAGQMTSFGLGRVVVTGCHCAHRMAALQGVGGFPDHQAEDLLLTQRYLAEGWRGVYVPQVLATGQAPETWSAYLAQQLRWMRSLLDIKIRKLPRFQTPGAVRLLLEYLQGFGYLYDAVLASGALLLLGSALATGRGAQAFQRFDTLPVALAWTLLAVSEAYRWQFYFKPFQARGPHWRAMILRLAKWPYNYWALWLVLRNVSVPYVVTPKSTTPRGRRRLLIPHLAIVLFLGLSLAAGLAAHHHPSADESVWAGLFGGFSFIMIAIDLMQ